MASNVKRGKQKTRKVLTLRTVTTDKQLPEKLGKPARIKDGRRSASKVKDNTGKAGKARVSSLSFL